MLMLLPKYFLLATTGNDFSRQGPLQVANSKLSSQHQPICTLHLVLLLALSPYLQHQPSLGISPFPLATTSLSEWLVVCNVLWAEVIFSIVANDLQHGVDPYPELLSKMSLCTVTVNLCKWTPACL